jgi:hypothetical protein
MLPVLKKIATLFVISFSACLTVYAQAEPVPPTAAPQVETKISPEKQALIAELLRVMNTRQQTQEVLNTMLDRLEKEIPDMVSSGLSESVSKLTKQEQEELRIKLTQSAEESSQRLRDAISKKLDFAKLDEITGGVYGKYLSESEISDLISFYKSHTGQRVLQVTPEMLAESMERSQELMMPIIKDVMHDASTEETQKFQKEVTAIVESHHRVRRTGTAKRRPQ